MNVKVWVVCIGINYGGTAFDSVWATRDLAVTRAKALRDDTVFGDFVVIYEAHLNDPQHNLGEIIVRW
jgi:hypothetical protein